MSTDTVEDADADVEDSDDVVEYSDADVEDADDVVEDGEADVDDADFQKRRSVMAFNPVPVRRF